MSGLRRRVLTAFSEIMSANRGKSPAIVTHAGPIRVIVSEIVCSMDFWDVMPDPASVSVIEFTDGLPKIALVNDTSYL